MFNLQVWTREILYLQISCFFLLWEIICQPSTYATELSHSCQMFSFLSFFARPSSSSPIARVDPLLLQPSSPPISTAIATTTTGSQQNMIYSRPITATHHKSAPQFNNNWQNNNGAIEQVNIFDIQLLCKYLCLFFWWNDKLLYVTFICTAVLLVCVSVQKPNQRLSELEVRWSLRWTI